MRQGLRNGTVSVHLSVPFAPPCSSVRRVCCCGPGSQDISIDCGTAGGQPQHGAQQEMRAVSRYQRTQEAERRLAIIIISSSSIVLAFGVLAFSALTLLAGRQKQHPACKNGVMRCWCGYRSGMRCRLFAYGPADATASPNPIISCLI